MAKKIKIVHVIPSLDMGGAERLLLDIVKRIDKDFFSLTIICFVRGGVWAEEIINAGARLIILEKKNKFDLINLFKLWRALKNEQPDLVHTHLGGDIYGRFLAHFLKVPIVSTEHNLNKDEGLAAKILKRFTAAYASLIIAVSQAVAKDALGRYKLKADKIKVIHNGIDVLRFSKTSIFKNDLIKIGSIGRLVTQKGFSVLLKALSLIKDHRIDCTIIGAGYLKANLQTEIDSLGLSDKVHLSGLTNDIPSFLNTLDIFVVPSLWEGLGIAAIEAGAAALPVIASNVDGLAEIIDDQTNGLLFKVNDPKDLALKINYLIEHQSEARVFGEKLAQKVSEEFDVANMVRQYELSYRALLS